MAKVGTIEYTFEQQEFKTPVYVNSKGIFKVMLPPAVASALQIDKEQNASTLSDLHHVFFEALINYQNRVTTEDLLIAIQYAAHGEYTYKKNKESVLFGNNTSYELRFNSWNSISCLGFDFHVVIKETIDGKVKYYEAKKGKELRLKDKYTIQYESHPEKFFKYCLFQERENHQFIPYSEMSHQVLLQAREQIRTLSELLFNFITQEPAQIESTLLNQKLLG